MDPYAMIMMMAQSNPAARQVLEMMRKGMSPEAVFRQLCQQRGVDPDQFLRTIQGYTRQKAPI